MSTPVDQTLFEMRKAFLKGDDEAFKKAIEDRYEGVQEKFNEAEPNSEEEVFKQNS